jgi:hypothetical protein
MPPTIEDFVACLKTVFHIVYGDGQKLSVELTEVNLLGQKPLYPDQKAFSLIFQSTITHYLPQGTYTVEHEKMPTMGVFIVPIGPGNGGMRYEAIFN